MSDPDGTSKKDGLGDEGTIPVSDDGIAVTLGDTDTHFNHEEDSAVTDGDDTADSEGVQHGDD